MTWWMSFSNQTPHPHPSNTFAPPLGVHMPSLSLSLSLSPIIISHQDAAVSAFTLKHIYIQPSVWSAAPVILSPGLIQYYRSDTMSKLMEWDFIIFICILDRIDTESNSKQTVFTLVWFDSSGDSAAITLCTVLSKVINTGFSNQLLWLCLVCQINVVCTLMLLLFYLVSPCVPFCSFLLTQSKEKMFLNTSVHLLVSYYNDVCIYVCSLSPCKQVDPIGNCERQSGIVYFKHLCIYLYTSMQCVLHKYMCTFWQD